MRLENYKLEYKNPLVNDYLYDFDNVASLFQYNPHDDASFTRRAEVLKRKYTLDREKLVEILREYNISLGCGERTLTNIEKLSDDNGLMIITGQQPGVLTGPLYTVYKAMTAIKLADKMSEQLAQPVVPAFWVGSEDHDFGEISHVELLNKERVERIRLEESPGKKMSVGHIPISGDVFSLIEKLAAATPQSEFKNDIIEQLKHFAKSSSGLGDWFARIMSWFFDDYGLVMINPLDSRYKEMGMEIYKKFIRSNAIINEAFRSGQEKVRALGHTPQVEKDENNTHLFVYLDGERLPLLVNKDQFYVQGRDEEWTRNELLHIIEQNPEFMSANVVLKPVFQDYVFPILAYIAGPGEIGYYALYKEIYPIVGGEMPVIYPRANVTMVEKSVSRYLSNFNLNLGDILYNLDEKLKNMLTEADKIGIDKIFEDFKSKLVDDYREVIEKIAELDDNLIKLGEENTRRIISQIEHLESKAHQQLRKKHEDSIKQFNKIRLNLIPQNNMQERIFNIFPFSFKYGIGIINNLMQLPLIDGFDHKLVYL